MRQEARGERSLASALRSGSLLRGGLHGRRAHSLGLLGAVLLLGALVAAWTAPTLRVPVALDSGGDPGGPSTAASGALLAGRMGPHGWSMDLAPWRDEGSVLWTIGPMDSMASPRAAQHRVLVDGLPLPLPHALHAEIADPGEGRHSFWSGALYFSLPPSSDPATALVEVELRQRVRAWVTVAGVVGAALLVVWFTRQVAPARLPTIVATGVTALAVALLLATWFAPTLSRAADSIPPLLLLMALLGAALAWSAQVSSILHRRAIRRRAVGADGPRTHDALLASVDRATERAHRLWSATMGRLDGWRGRLVVVAILLLSLLRMWAPLPTPDHLGSDVAPSSMFRGRILASDALGYWHGAEHLRCAGELNYFASRRPIYPALLAAESWLLGGNRPLVMLLNAGIVGLTLAALASAAGCCAGPSVGLATLGLCVGYAQQFVAVPLTEQLGLALGALALVFLLDGFASVRLSRVALGSFLLALAMMARAGALFALPALGLAALCVVRPRRRAVAALAACVLPMAVAWGVNQAIFSSTGAADAAPNANFAHVALGMAMGGDWTDAERWFQSQPAAAGPTGDRQRSELMYAEFMRRVREDPRPLLGSLWRSSRLFASEWSSTAWQRFGDRGWVDGFLQRTQPLGRWWSPTAAGAIAAGLGMLAVVRLSFLRSRIGVATDPTSGVASGGASGGASTWALPLLLLLVGTLLSMPVVWTDGRWRVLAPTMPLMAMISSLWLMAPRLWLQGRSACPASATAAQVWGRPLASRALAVASLVLASAPLAAGLLLPLLALRWAEVSVPPWPAGTMAVPTPARLGAVIAGDREAFSWFGPLRTTHEAIVEEISAWNRDPRLLSRLPSGDGEYALVQALAIAGHADSPRTMLLVASPKALESTARRQTWLVEVTDPSGYHGALGRLIDERGGPALSDVVGTGVER